MNKCYGINCIHKKHVVLCSYRQPNCGAEFESFSFLHTLRVEGILEFFKYLPKHLIILNGGQPEAVGVSIVVACAAAMTLDEGS